jgi:hypothetical protein
VAIVVRVLRGYSYLLHLVFALFLLGVSAVSALGAPHTFGVSLLPWEGRTLRAALFAASLFGLASLALAVMSKVRFLFALWATVVFGAVFRGFFLTGHIFAGRDAFLEGVYITLAVFLAAVAAWLPAPGRS